MVSLPNMELWCYKLICLINLCNERRKVLKNRVNVMKVSLKLSIFCAWAHSFFIIVNSL